MKMLRLVLIALTSLFGASSAWADCAPQNDVLRALRCIEGLTVDEVVSTTVGYRQFEMTLVTPTDHGQPNGETFAQRLVLLHSGWSDPMVLQTSGYSIFKPGISRLAQTFGANQIQVEHRFFSGSTPASLDWTKLDIRQSAADFHRVVVAFKQLYRHRWVGTGASKGGMTSVYHRRFYPRDLDGTVADVAPLSFSTDDRRYVTFVDAVGGAPYGACRAKLEALQSILLTRRAAMESRVTGTFTRLGGVSVALEHAVVELPFVYWQYGDPEDADTGCARVPTNAASNDALYAFLEAVNDVTGYGDDGFETFQSYFFQAGTELGGPGAKLSHLSGLRRHDYTIDQYMPVGVPYSFSDASMRDVEQWVRNEASGIMFVYGEFDPWTAGAFPDVGDRDVHWFAAPGANHGAKFNLLAPADRTDAVATLTRWFDRQPALDIDFESAVPTLDDMELQAKRKLRLP